MRTFQEPLSLEDKIQAARERGWWNSGVWRDDLGQVRVTLDRFIVSVEEFMLIILFLNLLLGLKKIL
ncbi:hypothetical protein B7486_50830 [cyanobacterium TDX16]|nr:hypothetical protein B7486_50830 [cyanobacterium TDX16]